MTLPTVGGHGPAQGTGPSPVNDPAPPRHGRVRREESKSTLGTDSRVARVGPTTPTHLRGLPLALRWPDQLQCCRTWLSSEPLSPAAGDRGPRRFAHVPAADQGLDPGIRGDLGGQKAHPVPKAPIEATNHGERPNDPQAWRQRNIKPAIRPSGVGQLTTHDSSFLLPQSAPRSRAARTHRHDPRPASSPSGPPVDQWSDDGPFQGPRIEVGLTPATLHSEAG